MLMIAARRLAYLLLIALISGWLPQAAVVAPLPAAPVALAAPAGGALGDPPAPPAPLKVAPVTDPHLPSLSLHITVAPDPVALGDTVALTITLMNDAPDPANNVVITLPTPDGALAVPGPNTISPTGGWQWALKSLDGRSSTSVTGSLRMVQRPAGDALLLRATVIAQGLAQPLPGVGGALVVDRTLGPVTSPFTPGSPVTVRSRDGRIQVQVPARAAAQALTLRYGTTPLDGARIPPATANFHRGMGAFFLDATDAQGTAVHQFTAPLTITMSYTPEQLDALGIAEPDLTLFWFDDTTPITHTDGLVTYGQWLPIPTTVDARTHRATVGVDHFTTFELSDGSSPSIAFLPGIQGWQVSLFTGAAAYSYPIDLPAGPGGFKPSLSLSYSSAATDGDAGKRQLAQAGWVGQGWSLDTGSIAANKMVNGQNYYALTVNGQSFDLLRGAALVSPSDDTNPTNWEWKPTDENFMRVRAVSNGTSDPATGGGYDRNHVLIPRTRWQVWMKDGTRYDFADEAWWGFCGDADSVIEPSRWLLSQVVDTHGNSITYTYDHSGMAITKLTDTSGCAHVQGTVYKDIWPSTISWAGGRYQVNFISSARTDDLNYATASNQFLGPDDTQHQTRQLNAIQVWSNPAGSWQLVRQYNLGYDYSLTPDTMTCPSSCSATNTDYRKLTLTSIQRVGSNGALFPSTLTPIKTTFGYGGFGSTTDTNGSWVAGSWNRLTSVNNGQGGTVSFAYANVGQAAGNHLMDNNRRVISKTIGDGQDHSYTWNYSYGTPNVNSLGTTRGPLALQWNYDNYGTQTYPNSAALYYNAFIDTSANQQVWLAHKAMREFRGHDYVAETDPTGAQTEHWFHQGEAVTSASLPDITCVPTITGPTLPTGLCFQELRNGEQLKGREYRTRVRASAGGTQLQEIDHAFSVTWFPSNLSIPLAGLWHAFTAETQADLYSGTSSLSVKKTTRYTYDPSYTSIYSPTTGLYEASNVQYGNLSMIEEDTQDGVTPLRVTERRYSGRTDGVNYLVDRQYSESVRDGLPPNGLLRAMSQTFFDGNNTSPMTLGTIGDVTRVAKYYDVPLANNAQNVTLHGQDTTFTYDSWGNQLTETTYAQPGTRWYDGTNWDISAPGASSATRTSTTAYDGMFHAFPTSFSNPLGQTTRADYDYRMGTLIRVTGPNTSGTPTDCTPTSFSIPATEESSCAQYDVFGRMIALVKPGDSTSYPTVQATYYDTESRSTTWCSSARSAARPASARSSTSTTAWGAKSR